MQQVKEAFLSQDALAIVVALVVEPLSQVNRMGEQDAQLVQLVITFIRNLLSIPDRSITAGELQDILIACYAWSIAMYYLQGQDNSVAINSHRLAAGKSLMWGPA